MKQVLVIGGGAAGMMAAITAARQGAAVTIWEKKDQLGKKLRITGKGRCNLTNACTLDELVQNMAGNGKFLYSAFHAFSNEDTMAFFEELGVPLKVERGKRVFPVSDRASDVVRALTEELKCCGVQVIYQRAATKILTVDEAAKTTVVGAAYQGGEKKAYFDAVILATGGCSYPGTGSTGDGYDLTKALGHTIKPIRPALVPLVAAEDWLPELAGLSLRNIKVALKNPITRKVLAEDFGEMLFTHFGLSGPIILSLSKTACDFWQKQPQTPLQVCIDLKPALQPEQLDERLQRDFQKYIRKQFHNALGDLLPKSMIPVIVSRSEIAPETSVHQITKAQRRLLVQLLKQFTVTVTKPRPIAEAIVTAGGVSLKEVDPKTFQSKLVSGLYLVGELLDLDGYTGGYNLQAAFSSGYVAGIHAAQS